MLLNIGGQGFSAEATAVVIQPDGKIVVAGYSWFTDEPLATTFVLVRSNANGALDTGFSGDGVVEENFCTFNYPAALVLQPDSKLLVAGALSDNLDDED